MRVAVVHSVYADEGLSGENVVVDEQVAMLRDAGHEVLVETRRTVTQAKRPFYRAQAAWRVASGVGGDPSSNLRDFGPDVVHVHNLFPNFGTAWLDRWPGAVVATLHNYRYMCANGLFLRDGRHCFDCPTGSAWSGVKHACYRDSRLATLPLAIANRRGASRSPVIQRADRLIALADHSRDLFVRFGVASEDIDIVPNGIAQRFASATPAPAAPRFLVVGRLSPEKGVDRLLRIWPEGVLLDVVGDGPQADAIRQLAPPSVQLLGSLDASWRDTAPDYTALLAPGHAIEAFPLVVAEAWEAGLPVIAFDGGGVADAVRRTGAGAVYGNSAELLAALRAVASAGMPLRTRARDTYESRHTPSSWVAAVEGVYARAMRQREADLTTDRRGRD